MTYYNLAIRSLSFTKLFNDLSRIFPNGNELQFHYVNGEPVGEAVLVSEAGKEEFKFVNGQKEVSGWP
jgi:hypothetical protein